MAYKLVIADVVEVPVKFTVADGGKTQQFAFTLHAKRMPQSELYSMQGDNSTTKAEFLRDRVTGWKGQRLVVDDGGEPAAFGAEAFDCMLSLIGMVDILIDAYIAACGVKGKEKN